MKQFLHELFEYNCYCNQKLADAFQDNRGRTTEKATTLFNHILNAHQIWNNRIEPEHTPFGVWEIHAIDDLKKIDELNSAHSLRILDKPDLNATINYTNSKGQVFSNSIWDILFHVINHSTYHRGQIATEFKNTGLAPLATDYIFYKR